MRHQEFAELTARRLENVAEGLERGCGLAASSRQSVRAQEMRIAALVVREEVMTVTKREASNLIVSAANERLEAWSRARTILEHGQEMENPGNH